MKLTAIAVLMCLSGLVQAQGAVNKCTDGKGKVTFQSEPCAGETVAADLAKRKADGATKDGDQVLIFGKNGWEAVSPAEAARQGARKAFQSDASYVAAPPKIGMSTDEAAWSTWGGPQKKNTTQTAKGTMEQWVYPNRGYLYFTDGVLTGIQAR